MAELGSLFVRYVADTTEWTKGVNQVLRDTKDLEKQINSTMKLFTGIGGILSAAGAAIVGTFTAAAKSAANYGDAIRDASIRTGLTTEALSGFKFAAEQTGTSFEELQVGLKKFAVAANEAAQGTKKQVDLFHQFGVSVKDSAGNIKPLQSLLGEVAERFRQMPDGVQKTSAAVAFFGKTGVNLTEFLNQGSEGLAKLTKEAERLGLVIGSDAAKQADDFNDSLNEMENATKGLSIVIGNVLLPKLTNLAVTVTNLIARFTQFAKENEGVISFVFKLGAVLGTGGALFLGLAGLLALIPKITLAWNALTVAMAANPFGFLAVAVTTAIVALITFRKEITEGLATAFEKLAKIGIGIPGLFSSAKLQEFANILRNTQKTVDDYGPSFDQLVMAHKGFNPILEDNSEEAKKFNAALEKMREQLTGNTTEMRALDKVILEFSTSGVPAQILIEKLGDEALKAANNWTNLGKAVPEATRQLALATIFFQNIIKLQREAANAAGEITATISRNSLALSASLFQASQMAQKALDQITDTEIFRQRFREIGNLIDPLRKQLETQIEIPAPRLGISNISKQITDQTVASIDKLRVSATEIAAKIFALQQQGLNAAQIARILGSEIDDASDTIKVFGKDLDAGTIALIKQGKAAKDASDNAKQFEQAWSHALGQVIADFAKAITEMIFSGGSFASRMKNIGLAAAKGFTESFILQLVQPLIKAFTDLGGHLANIINGWLAPLEKRLGSFLADIAGIGSGAAKGAGTVVQAGTQVAGAAGTAGTAASGAINVAGGLANAAVGGLISGGLAAAGSLLGSGRLEGTMNAVEYNTRASRIHLEVIIDQLLWPIKFATENLYTINYYAQYLAERLIPLMDDLIVAVKGITIQAAQTIPKMQMGGYVTGEGLVYAHAGESIVPAAWERRSTSNVHVDVGGIHIQATGADLANPEEFAQKIMRRLDREIMTGNRGFTGKWSKRFSQNRGNITTSPVRGG